MDFLNTSNVKGRVRAHNVQLKCEDAASPVAACSQGVMLSELAKDPQNDPCSQFSNELWLPRGDFKSNYILSFLQQFLIIKNILKIFQESIYQMNPHTFINNSPIMS